MAKLLMAGDHQICSLGVCNCYRKELSIKVYHLQATQHPSMFVKFWKVLYRFLGDNESD